MKNTLPDPDSRYGATETGGEFEFPLELEDDRPPTSDPFDFVYSDRPAPRAPVEWDLSADGKRTAAASEWRRRVFRLSLFGALLAGALFAVPIVQRGNLSSLFDWSGSAPSTDASAPEPAPAPETLPPVIADTPPAATTPVPDADASAAPAAVPQPPIDTASSPRIERDQSQSAVAAAPPPPSASSARPSSIETARKPPPVETSARSRRAEAPKPPARVVLPPPQSQTLLSAPAPTTASAPAPTPPPPSAPTSPLSPQTASASPAPAPASSAQAAPPAAAPTTAPATTPTSPDANRSGVLPDANRVAAAPATTPTPPASTASASSSAPAAASAAAAPRPAAPIVDRLRETDTRAIDGALARYRNAFNTLNAGAAAEVWPSVDKRTLTRAFEQLKEQRIAFDGCQTDIKDTRAQAVCTGLTRYVPRIGGRLQVDRRQWTFNLAKVKDEWVIRSVEAR
jgi:hypothetical protein